MANEETQSDNMATVITITAPEEEQIVWGSPWDDMIDPKDAHYGDFIAFEKWMSKESARIANPALPDSGFDGPWDSMGTLERIDLYAIIGSIVRHAVKSIQKK
jgi:hypothetical protein